MKIEYEALVNYSKDYFKDKNVSEEDFNQFFPKYLRESVVLEYGFFKDMLMKILLHLIRVGIRVFLKPRNESVGSLDADEVKHVYDLESSTYDFKHHLTTRGKDTSWRRFAGYCVLNYFRKVRHPIRVLDLCTGTGLNIKEMINVCRHWGVKAEFVGLDYNDNMLNLAKERNYDSDFSVRFDHGDAMNFVESDTPLTWYRPEVFDIVTQMCGIGGIYNPISVFENVIQVLKPGGQYFMSDMHRPIYGQLGELPLLILFWFKMPVYEIFTYKHTTIPVVLNKLWAWRDTTLDFYTLPLITCQSENGKYYGFKVVSFETESQRWWLSLPIMPVAKIIVEKIEISEEEFLKRNTILQYI